MDEKVLYSDTDTCPKCGDENAYFNGICYECPDCGHEWGYYEDEGE